MIIVTADGCKPRFGDAFVVRSRSENGAKSVVSRPPVLEFRELR
jgi:hypothetical protein